MTETYTIKILAGGKRFDIYVSDNELMETEILFESIDGETVEFELWVLLNDEDEVMLVMQSGDKCHFTAEAFRDSITGEVKAMASQLTAKEHDEEHDERKRDGNN